MVWSDDKAAGEKILSADRNSLVDAFSKFTVPFVTGSAYDARGWDIDAGAEFAATWFQLPSHVVAVEGILIYAHSRVTEADAMHLEININGGADNEPYNTHSYAGTAVNSASTNFAAADIIYWDVIDAAIQALKGGDSVEVNVVYESAGGADAATDAQFRAIEVYYT